MTEQNSIPDINDVAGAENAAPVGSEQTFTQAEVDEIVSRRLAEKQSVPRPAPSVPKII